MKNLKELSDKLKQFDDLPKNQKNAILQLIDLKTELDMREVIMEIKSMKSEFESKFSAVESKFESKFSAIESKFSAIESKFSILLWVISAIGLMIAVFKFVK